MEDRLLLSSLPLPGIQVAPLPAVLVTGLGQASAALANPVQNAISLSNAAYEATSAKTTGGSLGGSFPGPKPATEASMAAPAETATVSCPSGQGARPVALASHPCEAAKHKPPLVGTLSHQQHDHRPNPPSPSSAALLASGAPVPVPSNSEALPDDDQQATVNMNVSAGSITNSAQNMPTGTSSKTDQAADTAAANPAPNKQPDIGGIVSSLELPGPAPAEQPRPNEETKPDAAYINAGNLLGSNNVVAGQGQVPLPHLFTYQAFETVWRPSGHPQAQTMMGTPPDLVQAIALLGEPPADHQLPSGSIGGFSLPAALAKAYAMEAAGFLANDISGTNDISAGGQLDRIYGSVGGLLLTTALLKQLDNGGDQPTIMLVESDEATRDAMTVRLFEEGYLVLAAATGRDAWKMLRTPFARIDALLLDGQLPDMSSLHLCQRLREFYPALPVMVWTVGADSAEASQFQELGVRYCFRKPVELEQLLAKVKMFLL